MPDPRLDGYELERIRLRMRSGVPFTRNDLIAVNAPAAEVIDLVDASIARFLSHDWIAETTVGGVKAWEPT